MVEPTQRMLIIHIHCFACYCDVMLTARRRLKSISRKKEM